MTLIGKFSESLSGCGPIGLLRFFYRSVCTKVSLLSAYRNESHISIAILVDSFGHKPCLCAHAGIGPVLLSRSCSQVALSVICSVSINMINFGRFFAEEKNPDYAMGIHATAVQSDAPVVMGSVEKDGVRTFSCVLSIPSRRCGMGFGEMAFWSFAPRQNPGFRVIVEALAQISLFGQNACSHLVLATGSLVRIGSRLWRGAVDPQRIPNASMQQGYV